MESQDAKNVNSARPLHKSDKPWLPSHKQRVLENKRKSLEAEILFIMNRLTPTNFERLAVEMMNLKLTTYEDLQELVKIFFDKVTSDDLFIETYALLGKKMCRLKVPPPANIKENHSTFRVVMLTKCQQEFEADKAVVFEDPEEKKKKIESELPEGPERQDCIENTLKQMIARKRKYYGNIGFIGELFKLGMLNENIMHDCIYRLLKACDDDSLICLCILLINVGQLLDTDKAKKRMDQYFAQMSKIAEKRKSRIKFVLKETLDFRNNNWAPRRQQSDSKRTAVRNSKPRDKCISPIIDKDGQTNTSDVLTRYEVELKAKTMFKEFLVTADLDKAKLCLKELEGQSCLSVLVSYCIHNVLEKSKEERNITGQFFHEMVANNIIPCDIYFKGLSEFLQFAADLERATPTIWKSVAHVIAPVIIGGSVHLPALIQVFQDCLEIGYCANVLAEILSHAKSITSKAFVARMWQSSHLEWSLIVGHSNVTKFLEENKLRFTIAPC